MSLKYEPSSEPLHISEKLLFSKRQVTKHACTYQRSSKISGKVFDWDLEDLSRSGALRKTLDPGPRTPNPEPWTLDPEP